MIQLVTGYLPSVILLLFFYAVPPTMMLFSTVEGAISRSGRKKSACCKVLYFTIWNVFFVNVLSASVIHQLMFISHPKDIPFVLARTLPGQVQIHAMPKNFWWYTAFSLCLSKAKNRAANGGERRRTAAKGRTAANGRLRSVSTRTQSLAFAAAERHRADGNEKEWPGCPK
ncbi:hypothetical protein M5K25_025799 [Dendrobium thyrsiflorum]|uniref:CSC1/OSCA1-like 7TM region domain-containing protein n=1 Tax=Dendrobium thyrsiflorum TaxID=117978 RepID=A0ABD0UAC0_DENTH